MMQDRSLLGSLYLRNILSFGPDPAEIRLQPLNVLVGPNGAGKSNLIEVLGLLRELPQGFVGKARRVSELRDWSYKYDSERLPLEVASTWEGEPGTGSLRHRIGLSVEVQPPTVISEFIDRVEESQETTCNLYYYKKSPLQELSPPLIWDEKVRGPVSLTAGAFRSDSSILAQWRDPERYTSLTWLSDRYSAIRIYRQWVFGPNSPGRVPQVDTAADEHLDEDGGNLALVLRRVQHDPDTERRVLKALQTAYEGIEGVRVREIPGYVTFALSESGSRVIQASRLSDGTLRFLSLLVILCDPDPPPLVCLEEPELGLHPDVIPTLAELLVEASNRTQLVVTTHSADLVSALGDVPESVVVCERGAGGTTLKRLEPDRLRKWLDDYSLGHLWRMGEIGGNRW